MQYFVVDDVVLDFGSVFLDMFYMCVVLDVFQRQFVYQVYVVMDLDSFIGNYCQCFGCFEFCYGYVGFGYGVLFKFLVVVLG